MLTADFKYSSKIGSPTGFNGTFCGVLSLAPWTETSGGHGYQLAFGYEEEGHPRLALRGSDLSAAYWNSWYKVYTSDDKPTLSELGAAAASHTHTKAEITDFAHTHDDRYYTESEIDTKLSGKAASSHKHAAADITSVNASAITGTIAAANLPSYVAIKTTGTGAAYAATVDGITALTIGAKFTIVPHTVSTTTAPTLNVNGLGAKNIRMRLTSSTTATIQLTSASFLTANKPVNVVYDGSYWVIDDFVQPDVNSLYGTVPISKGGITAAERAKWNAKADVTIGTAKPTSSTSGIFYIQTN